MGILNNSKLKGKKWKEKKERYPQRNATALEQDSTSVIKPEPVEQPVKEQQSITTEASNKIVDPDLEFLRMYGLTEKAPAKALLPKPVIKPKPIINKQLTIILIENTATVGKEKDKVLQIIESLTKSNLTCIINYGETVIKSEIFEISNPAVPSISDNEMTGEKTCLFDALVQLDKIVTSKYLSIEERKNERVRINNISIIGIGTCRDNCSTVPKEEALNSFYKVASKANVTTKYFCLSDEYCMKVAEIGFHSIGTISRTFQ